MSQDWLLDIQGYTTVLDANGDPVQRRRSIQIVNAAVQDTGTVTRITVPGNGPTGPGGTGPTGPTGSTGPTGNVNFSHAPFVALSIVSNAVDIDLSQGGLFRLVLTANVNTTTMSGVTNGEANFFTLQISQDGTGGRSFTPPASWTFSTGDYVVSSAAGADDLLQGISYDNGTTWLVSYLRDYV